MLLKKRNGQVYDISIKNNNFCSSVNIGQRDTIFFVCSSCGKDASRRVSLWNEKNIEELMCEKCNRAKRNLEKYGVENPMQVPEIASKLKLSNLEKYGVENPMQVSEIASKSGSTRRKFSYTSRKEFDNVEIITPFEDYEGTHKTYDFKCKKCGHEFSYNTQDIKRSPRCPICNPKNNSLLEGDFFDYIDSFGFSTVKNTRDVIPPYEIDIYIPEKKVAFEFNGLYWHGENRLKEKARKYHINKTELCKKKDIQLIQILEDEWNDNKKITKNRIRSILSDFSTKVYGRKCIINEISAKEKNRFLKENHIQGADKSNVRLGAFYNNELISVMTFVKPRHFMGGTKGFELSRFASKTDMRAVGVASKMLKYFIRNYSPKYIYSYSDKRWSNGDLYKKIGFAYSSSSAPNYWYFKSNKRHYRYNFRKSRLKELFPDIYEDEKTESQIMSEAGYDRIWDCGNDRWEMFI